MQIRQGGDWKFTEKSDINTSQNYKMIRQGLKQAWKRWTLSRVNGHESSWRTLEGLVSTFPSVLKIHFSAVIYSSLDSTEPCTMLMN